MRRHIKKHPGQMDTPKTIMYEIKQIVLRATKAEETETEKELSYYH